MPVLGMVHHNACAGAPAKQNIHHGGTEKNREEHGTNEPYFDKLSTSIRHVRTYKGTERDQEISCQFRSLKNRTKGTRVLSLRVPPACSSGGVSRSAP
jgi:hypothetical protein